MSTEIAGNDSLSWSTGGMDFSGMTGESAGVGSELVAILGSTGIGARPGAFSGEMETKSA